jgi:hypothetical protein
MPDSSPGFTFGGSDVNGWGFRQKEPGPRGSGNACNPAMTLSFFCFSFSAALYDTVVARE